MPIESSKQATQATRIIDASNYAQELTKYPQVAQQIALDLLEHLNKVNVLINLHDVCPERVSTSQIKEARVKLQAHFERMAQQKVGVPLTTEARTSSNLCFSFLLNWELSRVASGEQVPHNEMPEFEISKACQEGLNDAMLLKDTSSHCTTFKQILGLLKLEYGCIASELDLIPTEEGRQEAHIKLQSLLVNLLIVSRALCVLTVTNKSKLEHGLPSDQDVGDLFDRMFANGQKDVFLNDLSKLTQIENSRYSGIKPVSDQSYIQSYMVHMLSHATAIRHLALEISNAFYHQSFAENQSAEYQQCLQNGFDAGLLLLDTIDTANKYRQQHPQFCPKPLSQSQLKQQALSSAYQKQSQAEKVAELLAINACPTLGNLTGPTANLYLPDLVLESLDQELETAQEGLDQINELLSLKVLSEPMHQSLLAKKQEIEQSIERAKNPELAFDLFKQYPVPQASNWESLFNHQEILACSQIRKLPTSDGTGLFEVGIQAKPNSQGLESPKVWLHLHTDHNFKVRKRQGILMSISKQIDKISAAHLKNDFFRNKGRKWEQVQQMQGRLDALVQRSPVSTQFIHCLLNAIKSHQVPVDSTL